MILCEFTAPSEATQLIALDDIALEDQWLDHIQSFSSFKLATEYETGGYVKPTFTDLALSPEMFLTSWLPPDTATVILIETETDRASGVVIFEGTAALGTYDRSSVAYRLTKTEDTTVVAESTVLSGTLLSNITLYCGATYLDLTVDATHARAVSPSITYTLTKEVSTLDLLSEMCSECTHAFEVVEGVLYLHDLLAAATEVALTEFDVFPSKYSGALSTNKLPVADDLKFIAAAGKNTEIANMTTVLESSLITIPCPIDQTKPRVLDTATLYDESTIQPVTSSMKVTNIVYNFDTNKMQMEGFGTVS